MIMYGGHGQGSTRTPTAKQAEYTCPELLQFVRFFPSHFTLGLPGSSFRYRHLMDEVLISISGIPPKLRTSHYNLLGFLYALQGNYNAAFKYFNEVLVHQENSIVSIANQAHCYLRQNLPSKAHDCLRRLINLTSSNDFMQITNESVYMSEAKTDLGFAYSVFGLNNAAKRMYEAALSYNGDNINACLGLARSLYSLAQHENRSTRDIFLRTGEEHVVRVLKQEPHLLIAAIQLLEIRSHRKLTTIAQIDAQIESFFNKDEAATKDPKVFRDLAKIKMTRNDYDGQYGVIELLNRSIAIAATAEAYFLLGRAHYMKWLKDKKKRKRILRKTFEKKEDLHQLEELKEEVEEGTCTSPSVNTAVQDQQVTAGSVIKALTEQEVLKEVKKYLEAAVKLSYNSSLEMLLELGVVMGKLQQTGVAADLLKRAADSEDSSVQERAYRYLAIFTSTGTKEVERYLREALSRQQHSVLLPRRERDEWWERVYRFTEDLLLDHSTAGSNKSVIEWLRLLVDNSYSKADYLIEIYNRDANVPLPGLNGDIPGIKRVQRKASRSRMA